MTEFWTAGPTGNMATATPMPTAAVAPASSFFQQAPKPAAGQQAEFWKSLPAIGQGGTPEQAQAFADEMVRTGAMTKEAADAALRAGGNEPAPVDDRTDDQKAFDATFAPPPAPEGYKLNLGGRWRDAQPDWLNDVHRDTVSFLGAMEMPASIGEALADRLFEVNAKVDAMRGPDRALWQQESKVQLQRVMGEKAPQRLEAAIAALKDRGGAYLALVIAKGLHNDPTVAANLILQAERLAARRGMK